MSHDAALRIGQFTNRPILGAESDPFYLRDEDGDQIALGATDTVTITTQHTTHGEIGASGDEVEIIDAEVGKIRYQFEPEEVIFDGTYEAQFTIDDGSGNTRVVPATDYYYIYVGRNLPSETAFDGVAQHAERTGGTHGIPGDERFASREWVLTEVDAIQGLSPDGTGDIGFYLYDDFGDNNSTSRTGRITGNYFLPDAEAWTIGSYRPSWDIGGASVANGEVTLDDTTRRLEIGSEVDIGRWEITGTVDDYSSDFHFYPILFDDGTDRHYWRISISPNYGLRVTSREPGEAAGTHHVETPLPSSFGTGDEFEIAVSRSRSDAWVVEFNGEQIATVHDPWLPDMSAGDHVIQANIGGTFRARIDSVYAAAIDPSRNVHAGDELAPHSLDVARNASLRGQAFAPAQTSPHLTIGLSEFGGSEALHQSTAGPYLIPHEPVHLGEVDVVAGSTGLLTFNVHEFTEADDQVAPLIDTLEFDVSQGRNTIALDYLLDEPEGFDGYVFTVEDSDVQLMREENRGDALPVQSGPLEMRGGAATTAASTLFPSTYFYFLDLQVTGASALESFSGGGTGTGTAPVDEENPGGAIVFVHPDDDAAGIQGGITALGAEGGCVWLRDGTYEMDVSVEIPDNVRLTASQRGAVTLHVPDAHNLTAYDGPHVGTVHAVLTNSDHTNGNTDITIENLDIDYDGANKTVDAGQYSSGIWLRNVTDSTVERSRVADVIPSNPEREYGFILTDCKSVDFIKNEAANCGYEGIGLRGENEDILVDRCVAIANGTHSLQIAGWSGGSDGSYFGRPKDITVRGGNYDGNFILHGIYDPTTTQTEKDHNIVLDRVTAQRFALYENVRHIKLRDCTGTVRLIGRQIGDRVSYVGQIEIDGLQHEGFGAAPIDIQLEGDGVEMADIRLSRIHGIANSTNGCVVYIQNRGSTAAINSTINRVTLADSNVEASSLVRVDDSDYSIGGFRVDDNDLSSVTNILDPASVAGAGVTVTRMLGNAGYTNYIEGIGGTNPN